MKINKSIGVRTIILAVMIATAGCSGQTPTSQPGPAAGAAATSTPATATAPTQPPQAATVPPSTSTVAQAAGAPTASPVPLQPTAAATQASAAGAPGDAREALLRAQRAQLGAKTSRARTTIQNLTSNTTLTTTVEFVAPDRAHMSMPGQEVIVISPTTYLKEPNGAWTKSPMDLSSAVFAARDPSALEEYSKDLTDVKLVGPDTVDGKPMLVYEYTYSSDEITSTAKIWLGVADNLPYKSETEGEAAGEKTRSTTVFDYDPNIKIEAPPVQ